MNFLMKSKFNPEKNRNVNPKEMHRLKCIHSIPCIRNISIPKYVEDNTKQAVFIEFRVLPHVEFIIKNTIIKLPTWNHIVICGNQNYDSIYKLSECLPLKIIKLDVDNLTTSDYSKLLLSTDFWERLSGEHILLYQEDSYLFHSEIDKFLKYDYIGAAWPESQDDNVNGVGNGGFSLRNKSKMLECLRNPNSNSLNIGRSTLNYMRNTNNSIIPEDVFFSKSLIDFNIGKVAQRDTANEFSQETQPCRNPLGGHNFWLAPNKKTFYTNLKLENEYFKIVTHRGGWKHVIQNLIDIKMVVETVNINSITFVDCMESRFSNWSSNKEPLKTPWIGIFHYSTDIPAFLKYDLNYISSQNNIISSLPYCKGIIVLSENSHQFLNKHPLYRSVPLKALKHPIEVIHNKFSMKEFQTQEKYGLLQLGLQDRKTTTIYTLKTNLRKIWLPGRNHIMYLEQEAKNYNITINKDTVDVIYYNTHEEFDNALYSNVVIIPLLGASANNSVLEIIEMNVPAFISRLPATEEYLGSEYPLFFDKDIEIENIINNRNILLQKMKEGYEYLCNMDKSQFRYEHFNRELYKFISK